MRDFSIEITCPLHAYRKETIWLLATPAKDSLGRTYYLCNGCDNSGSGPACKECISNMQSLHGGFRESNAQRQLREIFEIADNPKR